MAVREEAFPAEVKLFLQQFGIDYRKEADATQLGPPEGGLYPYTGWFNLVGKILVDPGDMTTLGGRFKFFFVSGSAGRPMPASNRLRLEFALFAPWTILEKPEASL